MRDLERDELYNHMKEYCRDRSFLLTKLQVKEGGLKLGCSS